MRRRITMALCLVLIAMLAFGAGMGTVAYFTSQAVSQNNVFATGTLEIGIPGEGPDSAFINADNWQPGDSVSEDIEVINLGTIDYKYQVTAQMESGDSHLYDKLDVLIEREDDVIYDGKLKDLSEELISNNLAAGDSENLTFTVILPTSADNTYQGLLCSVKFIFDATQTDNPDFDE